MSAKVSKKVSSRPKKQHWEITRCGWNSGEAANYLTDGWEPFSITEKPDGHGYADTYIYLRKKMKS